MKKVIYKFKHTQEIYSDEKGNFFRCIDNCPLNKVYQNGRIAIRDGNKFYGIKRLRENAYKTEIDEYINPFGQITQADIKFLKRLGIN